MKNKAFSLFSIASLQPLVVEQGLNNRSNNETLWGHDYIFQVERCYFTHYVFIVSLPANTVVSPRCATNADCRLADWRVNEVNIVVKCSNRVPIPKLDF